MDTRQKDSPIDRELKAIRDRLRVLDNEGLGLDIRYGRLKREYGYYGEVDHPGYCTKDRHHPDPKDILLTAESTA